MRLTEIFPQGRIIRASQQNFYGKSDFNVRFKEIFGLRGTLLLSRRSFLYRHRSTGGSAVFFAADTDNNRAFMADSVFERRKIVFKGAFAEFINGISLVRGISAIFHVDLSAAMVYVANLLRFRSRDGDFYIFSLCNRNFAISADNLRSKLNFFADTADRADLLLYDVALSVAGVADGDLFNELARSGRIYPRDDWIADCRANFIIDWNFFAPNVQNSR